MPWCPSCKNEYREGILECAECKIALVDQLPDKEDMVLLVAAEQEEFILKFKKYLEFSNMKSECRYLDEDQAYGIFVHEADVKQAKKAFSAFYSVEMDQATQAEPENAAQADEVTQEYENIPEKNDIEIEPDFDVTTTEDEEENDEADQKLKVFSPAKVYVKKSEQSKELKSSAVTFLFFGVALTLFFFLNLFKVILFFSNPFSLTILGLITLGCFAVGINSLSRAKKAEKDSILEEELTIQLNKWMKDHITEKIMADFFDSNDSDEIAYMKKTEGIKRKIIQVHGEMDDSYLENIIEEFYNSHFE